MKERDKHTNATNTQHKTKLKKAQQIIEVLAGVAESGSLFFSAYGAAVARH